MSTLPEQADHRQRAPELSDATLWVLPTHFSATTKWLWTGTGFALGMRYAG
ncbi:MAG: hypothetical protein ORN21_06360 [Methylophilaceae bacterium]|nr:hypothetical protein [Methylophilaceae bacterium]